MKLIKQKVITFSLSIFLALVGVIVMPANQIVVHAHSHDHEHEPQKLSKNNTLEPSKSSAIEIISRIEEELNEQGTSVIAELYNASSDRREDLLMTLNKIDEVIAYYERESYLLPRDSNFGEESIMSIYSTSYVFGISPNCTCKWYDYLLDVPCWNCQLYSDTLMAVSAIAAGFSVRGWSIASDLVWHSMSNTSLDSDYTPSSSLVN